MRFSAAGCSIAASNFLTPSTWAPLPANCTPCAALWSTQNWSQPSTSLHHRPASGLSDRHSQCTGAKMGPRYGGACNWARSAIDLTLALHMPSQQLGLMTWAVDDSFLGVGPVGVALALTSASGLSAAALLSMKPSAACVLGSTFASLRAEELFGAALPSAFALGSASLMVAEGQSREASVTAGGTPVAALAAAASVSSGGVDSVVAGVTGWLARPLAGGTPAVASAAALSVMTALAPARVSADPAKLISFIGETGLPGSLLHSLRAFVSLHRAAWNRPSLNADPGDFTPWLLFFVKWVCRLIGGSVGGQGCPLTAHRLGPLLDWQLLAEGDECSLTAHQLEVLAGLTSALMVAAGLGAATRARVREVRMFARPLPIDRVLHVLPRKPHMPGTTFEQHLDRDSVCQLWDALVQHNEG
ncbi:MAG: hypothetical protein FRX49_02953 [Trebouxia sp. A1-2]|nr:MAG: hypothetical protein FRX49_02953 [Trebouxia sp. A1-2]